MDGCSRRVLDAVQTSIFEILNFRPSLGMFSIKPANILGLRTGWSTIQVKVGESMADAKDVRGLRVARTELTKRGIDIGRCDMRVLHGTLYIKGMVSITRGVVIKDLRLEMEHIGRLLRQKPDIKDVVLDCQYMG